MTNINVDQDITNTIFIVWFHYHRRSDTIAKKFSIPIFFVNVNISSFIFYPIKLLYQIIKTFFIIKKSNPDFVIIQSPPLTCPFFIFLYSKILNFEFLIDNHNHSFSGFWFILTDIFVGKSKISFIHNKALYDSIKKRFKSVEKLFILEDAIPHIANIKNKNNENVNDKVNLTIISSMSKEENIPLIINSIKNISGLVVNITGNINNTYKELNDIILDHPSNINFSGYISNKDYINLLEKSDIILINDVRENILCCGGYEAIALEKPLIVPNNKATREYYLDNVIYINQEIRDINEKIKYSMDNLNELKRLIVDLKFKKIEEWKENSSKLKKVFLKID